LAIYCLQIWEALMTDQEVLDNARYIFTSGRMIHDWVQRITTGACMNMSCGTLGELSGPQMNMVMVVRVRESVSVKELAALLGVSPPSVSSMVDRLVDRGLLTRTPCEKDRRRVVIQVAPEIKEDLAHVEGVVLQSFIELVEALGPEITRNWCDVLRNIKDVLEKNQLSSIQR